jgi:hypothetical protein
MAVAARLPVQLEPQELLIQAAAAAVDKVTVDPAAPVLLL